VRILFATRQIWKRENFLRFEFFIKIQYYSFEFFIEMRLVFFEYIKKIFIFTVIFLFSNYVLHTLLSKKRADTD